MPKSDNKKNINTTRSVALLLKAATEDAASVNPLVSNTSATKKRKSPADVERPAIAAIALSKLDVVQTSAIMQTHNNGSSSSANTAASSTSKVDEVVILDKYSRLDKVNVKGYFTIDEKSASHLGISDSLLNIAKQYNEIYDDIEHECNINEILHAFKKIKQSDLVKPVDILMWKILTFLLDYMVSIKLYLASTEWANKQIAGCDYINERAIHGERLTAAILDLKDVLRESKLFDIFDIQKMHIQLLSVRRAPIKAERVKRKKESTEFQAEDVDQEGSSPNKKSKRRSQNVSMLFAQANLDDVRKRNNELEIENKRLRAIVIDKELIIQQMKEEKEQNQAVRLS